MAKAETIDDTIVVDLARVGGDAHDVIALHAGAEPRLLAAGATLVGAAAGRAAVLGGGDLRSVKLDGTGLLTLGGGDGHDKVAEVRGDRILLTIHASTSGDVRLTGIDGAGTVDVGQAAADEVAIGLTAQRIVYLRRTGGGAVLVSTSLAGKGEQALTKADLDARPIQITEAGDVLFGSAAGAFLAVGSAGEGTPRVLDPAAGSNVRIGKVHAGQVIYASDTPHWPALRVAKLDGLGVVSLIEEPPSVPFFSGLLPDGRVILLPLARGPDRGRARLQREARRDRSARGRHRGRGHRRAAARGRPGRSGLRGPHALGPGDPGVGVRRQRRRLAAPRGLRRQRRGAAPLGREPRAVRGPAPLSYQADRAVT
ncbi:MAG: hypothetical protein QM820_59500 [Minicystis sp.]